MEIGTRVRMTQNTSGCPALDGVVGESGEVTRIGEDDDEGYIEVRLDDPSKDPSGPFGWLLGYEPGTAVLTLDEVEAIEADGVETNEAREAVAA